ANPHSRAAYGKHVGLRGHAVVSHDLSAIFTRVGREARAADLKFFAREHRLRRSADLQGPLRWRARTDLKFTRVRGAVTVGLYEQRDLSAPTEIARQRHVHLIQAVQVSLRAGV